jgi:uncharacterized membrane protein
MNVLTRLLAAAAVATPLALTATPAHAIGLIILTRTDGTQTWIVDDG